MGWLVGLLWPAAGSVVSKVWTVAMGWWAMVAWFVFTTKDGYKWSRTRHQRNWR